MAERSALTETQVVNIARLAHIALAPREAERLTKELGRILAYVEQLEELDVEGVLPMTQVGLEAFDERGDAPPPGARADAPVPSLSQELALREASRVQDGGFAVPAFVDEG